MLCGNPFKAEYFASYSRSAVYTSGNHCRCSSVACKYPETEIPMRIFLCTMSSVCRTRGALNASECLHTL